MIISENTVMYAAHFTVYHIHKHTLTWKHWSTSQCDLFVLLLQWTEAVEVVTVWWQALWRHYVTPVTVYSVHVRKRGFVTLQWLRHSFSPVHLSTKHSQLQREKWTREMWICLHVKCHRAAHSIRLKLGFNSTVKQVLNSDTGWIDKKSLF